MHIGNPLLLLSALALTEASPASISYKSLYPLERATVVANRKAGYQYSPSLIGEAAFFPTGLPGDAIKEQDLALWDIDRKLTEGDIAKDIGAMKAAIAAHSGTFKTLDDRMAPMPFEVDEHVVKKVTGTALDALKAPGSLFIIDHQRGSNLVYTPADTVTDRLLAKIIFNVNDMFHIQTFHLVAIHDVGEAVHQAALQTLSEEHPVMLLLQRFMFQAYSTREELCFNPDGHWDKNFLISEKGYLLNNMHDRGLVSGPHDPKHPFKSFPFLSDAFEIRDTFKAFSTGAVDSYYASDAVMVDDIELQNWFAEANKVAKVHDFPQCETGCHPCTKDVLVDVLTHFGCINRVAHHSLNGGDPVSSKAIRPFHFNGMYALVRIKKGVADLMPFLPNPAQSLAYIVSLTTLNRPLYEEQNRTLAHAFGDQETLARMHEQTRKEAGAFMTRVKALSAKIRAKSFNKNGLSEGVPYIWRAVNPGTIPYFFAV
ncbi:Lipoxygenase [Lentithecium fluviatile CBS 122367]|uniref:Manganese lipoxygenase n=1 Tax=Lentithecium fluviatile CBS 122367 TaxID=1168545 RepID=A0A6G1IQQ9_9PLEO|nr:Lipoxygenase [Lentithecium fluviatile CBS 122367]